MRTSPAPLGAPHGLSNHHKQRPCTRVYEGAYTKHFTHKILTCISNNAQVNVHTKVISKTATNYQNLENELEILDRFLHWVKYLSDSFWSIFLNPSENTKKLEIGKMGSVTVPEKTSWILGEAFEKRMPHHESIKALWETKWKFPVSFPDFDLET